MSMSPTTRPPGAVRSERERQRLQAEFARQREQEEQRARIEADKRERLAAADAARLAARPYPLRLTESRCTVCHAATHFQQQAHTWPGWLAVVLRMKCFNHASLESWRFPRSSAIWRRHIPPPASMPRLSLPWHRQF
jgi:hypothetical protein